VYTSRPTTPQEQSTEPVSTLIVIPRVTIQQGSVSIQLPIRKAEEAKQWVDKLDTATPSIDLYKRQLKAFIDWNFAEGVIKDRENKALRQAQANKKKRSKKTIPLTIINTDAWDEYKEQLLNREANKKRKNAGPKNSRKGKQPQSQQTNQSTQRRPRARRFSISSESSLEELPQLPIQEAVEVENEENAANQQLTTNVTHGGFGHTGILDA